jgi:hypothetical protein
MPVASRLRNSDYIWTNYGNGSAKGNVGVVFDFAKLRSAINRVLEPGSAALLYNGIQCHQIFSVNYGIVDYVEWDTHQADDARLPNPIAYTYLKDRAQFSEEKELRISLSAIGTGRFVIPDGSLINFPTSLQLPFNFRSASPTGHFNRFSMGRIAISTICMPVCGRSVPKPSMGLCWAARDPFIGALQFDILPRCSGTSP